MMVLVQYKTMQRMANTVQYNEIKTRNQPQHIMQFTFEFPGLKSKVVHEGVLPCGLGWIL
jgi:hypothetical protein